MASRSSAKPSIAFVGAGNVASALAVALRNAGYKIDQIVARDRAASMKRARRLAREVGASAAVLGHEAITAEIAWFCVPDAAIAEAAARAAAVGDWRGKIALHSSGALTGDELHALRKKGAAVASAHPLMTFVRGSRPSLSGVPFAIEGDARAVRIARALVRDLGGHPFLILKQHKPVYHAWGTFVSPLLTALLTAGETVAVAAGIKRAAARKWVTPILNQTIANYARLGPQRSLSGPIPRGDIATIQKHLKVLGGIEGAREIYVALTRAALGGLSPKDRRELRRILPH